MVSSRDRSLRVVAVGRLGQPGHAVGLEGRRKACVLTVAHASLQAPSEGSNGRGGKEVSAVRW